MDVSLLREGGPILAAIGLGGLFALAVFFERLVYLHKARIRFSDFLFGIFNILEKGKVREAVSLCDETPGPVSRLMHSAIMHRGEGRDELRAVLDNAGRAEIARMERRLTVLSTIIQAAPLLGLAGTMIGILKTVLTVRERFPLVQTIDMTSGLVEALVCSIGGLAVAIPAYFMFSILVVRVDRIVLDMEQASADILAFMARFAGKPPIDADKAPNEAAEEI